MAKLERDVEFYALEELREYIIYNDVKIEEKDDLTYTFVKMYDKGYFFKADINNLMNEVRTILNKFAQAWEKDHDILEKDLIFFGPRKVLQKMETMSTKR